MLKLNATARLTAGKKEDLENIKKQIKEVEEKLDAIVEDGGRIAQNDPLMKRLRTLRQQRDKLK